MDFSKMNDYKFFLSLGTVTVAASLLTLVATFLIRLILVKAKIIYAGMDEVRKDDILREVARWAAFVCYGGLYVGCQFIGGQSFSFDGSFLVGIISGTAMTFAGSKAIYTAVHQIGKGIRKDRNAAIASLAQKGNLTADNFSKEDSISQENKTSNEDLKEEKTILEETKKVKEGKSAVKSWRIGSK